MELNGKALAIIHQPRIQFDDHSGKDALFFETYVSEDYAAMQIVALPEIPPGVKFDVGGLEGQPCWVECVPGKNLIKFLGWWKGWS